MVLDGHDVTGASAQTRAHLGLARTFQQPELFMGLTVREHLMLAMLSLLAAIAVALPLGILAAKQPRLGGYVLALVGVVQTIPSLALLVVLIPVAGIGAPPALIALFVYSTLPIVRNTYAGLDDIADSRPVHDYAFHQ